MKQLTFTEAFRARESPIAVACGLGVNTVAMLIEFARRNQRPDLILFADTGGENRKPMTTSRSFSSGSNGKDFRPSSPSITDRKDFRTRRHTPPWRGTACYAELRIMPDKRHAARSGLWQENLFHQMEAGTPARIHPRLASGAGNLERWRQSHQVYRARRRSG